MRFPAYYTCFEDTIIHFLVFRQAKAVVSVPEVVYLWRKNPKGLTATSQHRPAAVQSYWIMEQLLAQDAALGLPHDALYRCSLTLQLSAFAMPPYLDCRRKRSRPFSGLCCALYAKALPQESALPAVLAGVPVRCGSRTLGCGAATAEDFSCYNVRSTPMIRVLHSVSNMDRGGIETMLMNYYRHIDRSKVQFDFIVNKKSPATTMTRSAVWAGIYKARDLTRCITRRICALCSRL